MAFNKIILPAGWDWAVPVASMVKLGHDGRMGPNDRYDFIKRAGDYGANIFQRQMDSIKFAKDEIPVHVIALGAKEAWGPNRNGDAFTEATLKQAHDTFVKHAHWFRNHKNKKEEGHPHYGVVKASAYNPQMRRVELLVGLPTTTKAAELLGCNGPADREFEKLSRGEDLAVSMACRVPYDVCSGCHNRARTRKEYCKEANCKFGGCSDNLTRLVKVGNDVHLLHVENPNPIFFDISDVYRPADRTAYAGRADWVKAAEDGYGIDGAKLAEEMGIHAPMSVALAQADVNIGDWHPRIAAQIKLAHALAAFESRPDLWYNDLVKRAFDTALQPSIDLASVGLDTTDREKLAASLGALADQRIILAMRDFARMTKRAELSEAATRCLNGVYRRMIADGTLEQSLSDNRYAPSTKLASFKHRQAAIRLAPVYSLEKDAVDSRCRQSVCRGLDIPNPKSTFGIEKNAHDSPDVEKLARDYACYKVSALCHISAFDSEFMLTARLSACQNQVI